MAVGKGGVHLKCLKWNYDNIIIINLIVHLRRRLPKYYIAHKLCCHHDKLCCDYHFKKTTNIMNLRNTLKCVILEANQHIKKYAFTVFPYA